MTETVLEPTPETKPKRTRRSTPKTQALQDAIDGQAAQVAEADGAEKQGIVVPADGHIRTAYLGDAENPCRELVIVGQKEGEALIAASRGEDTALLRSLLDGKTRQEYLDNDDLPSTRQQREEALRLFDEFHASFGDNGVLAKLGDHSVIVSDPLIESLESATDALHEDAAYYESKASTGGFLSRAEIKLRRRRWHLANPLAPTHIRITRKGTYEVRFNTGVEQSFKRWNQICTYISFPEELQPALFGTLAEQKGQWVQFVNEDGSAAGV